MTEYDPHASVDKWLKLWADSGVFEAPRLTGEPGDGPNAYVVSMFSYPSGDLHMGHAEVYSISDAMARYARLRGFNTLSPIGWDSFGLPAENAALKRDMDPKTWTYDNIAVQAESFRRLGMSFDWRTRFHTSDPEYYRWNQWLFVRMFERGLAYRKSAPVNWCPVDKTVLANEQVIQGRCERCGSEVTRRDLTQWFFRTTAYAQQLLDDMAELEGHWPNDILAMQRNWIGRSVGAYLDFEVEGRAEPVRVFSTRPDTLYGATFFVVACDGDLALSLCVPERRAELLAYRDEMRAATDVDRLATDRPATGVELGAYAVNPGTGQRMPIYAADYVLAGYGTGAVMAVPAHDQRDLNFARAKGLPIRVVVDTGEADPAVSGVATSGAGALVNSGQFDGLVGQDAIDAVIADLGGRGVGEGAVTYRLRDWLVSRQRYWGTPIPIVHCDQCGEVPVADEELPVTLPESGYSLRPADGLSPLESATEWVQVACPRCGSPARRDTDTMDTFVDSSWYFMRYPTPNYTDGPFDPEVVGRWMPVDEYVGGKEHAILHLMYARFMTKVLADMGLLTCREPFRRLTNQGQVIMAGKAMSKSLGNLVNLQEQLALYGPDAVRVTMLFAGPPEDDIDWHDVSPTGSSKWLARVWRLVEEYAEVGSGAHRAPPENDLAARRATHRLVADVTAAMDGKRFNVAIARLMELTTLLRRVLSEEGAPAAREGIEALVQMLSCFAPFLAEEAWARLGREFSVATSGWPEVDPAMLVEEVVTAVVQVAGKVRDRLRVSPTISDEALTALALDSEKVQQALGGRTAARIVVRAPHLVSVVPGP